MKSVSRHKEASAGGGSSAQQGGLKYNSLNFNILLALTGLVMPGLCRQNLYKL